MAQIEQENLADRLYLDLLQRVLTRAIFSKSRMKIPLVKGTFSYWYYLLFRNLASFLFKWPNLEWVFEESFDPEKHAEGRVWPYEAETMVGLARLANLESCIVDILHRKVPGDLLEAGVWRGGASIFMRAVLKVYGDDQRTVWLADSFQGLPQPDVKGFPADKNSKFWQWKELAVSMEEVKANFVRYALLDNQVKFLVGFFHDTLPNAPIEQLAILRIDADMYQSTLEVLRNLYPKLSLGGYVIVDDYGGVQECKAAVDDFRQENNITSEIQRIDWTGIFWQKGS